MEMHHEWIFQILQSYAYQPGFVYLLVVGMMIASGFGFPLPEEVTIVSVGILAYMGAHPELFPPPYEGAQALNGYEAAAVTLTAVVFADLLVFTLGRRLGRKILNRPRIREMFGEAVMTRVNAWTKKYGIYAAFIFRFTPGFRFPAHIAMGASHFSAWQFLVVDGLAALISVPTQILLIYHFGEPILAAFKRFKMFVFGALGILIVYMVAKKIYSLMKISRDDGGEKEKTPASSEVLDSHHHHRQQHRQKTLHGRKKTKP